MKQNTEKKIIRTELAWWDLIKPYQGSYNIDKFVEWILSFKCLDLTEREKATIEFMKSQVVFYDVQQYFRFLQIIPVKVMQLSLTKKYYPQFLAQGNTFDLERLYLTELLEYFKEEPDAWEIVFSAFPSFFSKKSTLSDSALSLYYLSFLLSAMSYIPEKHWKNYINQERIIQILRSERFSSVALEELILQIPDDGICAQLMQIYFEKYTFPPDFRLLERIQMNLHIQEESYLIWLRKLLEDSKFYVPFDQVSMLHLKEGFNKIFKYFDQVSLEILSKVESKNISNKLGFHVDGKRITSIWPLFIKAYQQHKQACVFPLVAAHKYQVGFFSQCRVPKPILRKILNDEIERSTFSLTLSQENK